MFGLCQEYYVEHQLFSSILINNLDSSFKLKKKYPESRFVKTVLLLFLQMKIAWST